ncbi:DUF5662 family protein [Microcoleus sp. herbarium7]|uniref:DUF5662 family protein n=1 Tax=Microcoleus sp. herbarium7 TaxID=3055435 RepID=UPI002FD46883
MPTSDESTKALQAHIQTTEHIHLVSRLLSSAIVEFLRRILTHDRSKLASPEVEMFAEVTHKLSGLTYGSPEYEECRKQMMGAALGHHYYHNRHHPEHFESRGEDEEINDYVAALHRVIRSDSLDDQTLSTCNKLIARLNREQAEYISPINEMNLFDLLEMLVDWTAATKRHNDGDIQKSLEINRDRFFMGDQLSKIFENTIPWIEDEFAKLKTQRDL